MAETQPSDTPRTQPIWYRRWFQLMLGALLALSVAMVLLPPILGLLYAARSVLVPVVIALALAYVFNPLVGWLQRRARLPRPVSALLILAGVVIVALGVIAALTPIVIEQAEQLGGSAHTYAEKLSQQIDVAAVREKIQNFLESFVTPSEAEADAAAAAPLQDVQFSSVSRVAMNALGIGYDVVSTTIGFGTYLVLAVVIVAFCFFFFVWKFQPVLDFFVPFIPSKHRQRTLDILRQMDKTVAGFIRGRLIQAMSVATVLSVGWWLAGVPYWLLLGIAGGLLNLIPYAAVAVWPLAVLMAYLNWLTGGAADDAAQQATQAAADFNFMHIIVWPSVVYFLAQGLDGWVVEPLVQGEVTGLDPLTVLLCVLIGGSLMGLLGMLLAIPATACIKILLREAVLPKLRELAAQGT